MKKIKTKQYAERVMSLKKLQVSDKKGFEKELAKMINEFGFSRATIYRDMGKKQPNIRKRRSDAGKEKVKIPVTAKTIVAEVMAAGHTKQEAITVAEEITGCDISTKKAAEMELEIPEETAFASDAKKFIDKILQLDLIAPDAGLYFKYKGQAFKVDKNSLEDIALILATAYNLQMNQAVLNVDREQLVRSQLFQLIEEAMRIANDRFDMKLYNELTKMYKSLKSISNKELNTDFMIVEKAMKYLRPDITRGEVIALLEKAGE